MSTSHSTSPYDKTSHLGLGTWRFFLAFCVAISHLYANMIHGPAAYAVWGFFVLSGYLMTSILCVKYGNSIQGHAAYGFNRFIRIFPQYWLSCAIGLITISFALRFQIDPKSINPEFSLPNNTHNTLANIFLIQIFEPIGGRLVPVSGALATEILAYFLLPLFCRSISSTFCIAFIALVANSERGITVDSFPVRYTSFTTCILAFSIGALVFHFKDRLSTFRFPILSVISWVSHACLWLLFPSYPWEMGLYVSVALSAWVVLSIGDIKTGTLDTFLGDLSYPIYLLHTTMAVWILILFGDKIEFKSVSFFSASFILTLIASVIILIFFDRPIMRLKRKPITKA